MVANFRARVATLQNLTIYAIFATLAPKRHPRRSTLAIFGPTMSATPQFGDKIGPNPGPYEQHLKPDDARKACHEPTMSTKPSSKSRVMKTKVKKTSLCPVSLIAIKLKGLAAPGEALQNMLSAFPRRRVTGRGMINTQLREDLMKPTPNMSKNTYMSSGSEFPGLLHLKSAKTTVWSLSTL